MENSIRSKLESDIGFTAMNSTELLHHYIPRRLYHHDAKGNRVEVLDKELRLGAGPIIILGEPGMGKTELMKTLAANKKNAAFVRAASFVRRAEHWRDRHPKKTPFIDGLDEVAALEEGDPLHNVLRSLGKIDYPNFILTCRAADWRFVSAKLDIEDDYTTLPEIWTLDGISRSEAISFLSARLGDEGVAAQIIERFQTMGLDGYYENPLTLRLVAEIAESDGEVEVSSRTDLFERACDLLRIDPDRDHSALDGLSKDQSLDAAGAAMAALLITGKDAISISAATSVISELLNAAELKSLPRSSHINAVLKSRLFKLENESRQTFVPYHRTIAEFLSARWLARVLNGKGASAVRMLQMITVENKIPASLRGLHAWLALDTKFAEHVIDTDPYGLIRYGDVSKLSPENTLALIESLKRLEDEDPYFRAGDWNNVPGGAFLYVDLYSPLKTLITDPATGYQLKTLIIEMIHNSPVAPLLRDELVGLLLDDEEIYRSRSDAADVLVSLNLGSEDWINLIHKLRAIRSVDSTRLAIELIPHAAIENVSVELIVDCVLAETGFIRGDASNDRQSIGGLWHIRDKIPADTIPEVLDLILEGLDRYVEEDEDAGERWDKWYRLRSFGSRLVVRALHHQRPQPIRLLNWLRMFGSERYSEREETEKIREVLEANAQLRRDIQAYILLEETSEKPTNLSRIGIRNVSLGLLLSNEDILFHLKAIQKKGIHSERSREAWRTLIGASRTQEGVPDDVHALAMEAVSIDPDLNEILDPPPHPNDEKWRQQEAEWQRKRDKREAERQAENLKFREELNENRAALEAGELRWIAGAAKVYLCLYSDVDAEQSPMERVDTWIGEALSRSAALGFEAALHREDIPTSAEIAKGYANSKYFHFIHPILAGLGERFRTGQGFEGVPIDVLKSGIFGFDGEIIESRSGVQGLREALTNEFVSQDVKVELYREWFEPHFEAGASSFHGLYRFVRDEVNSDFAPQLCLEWLARFADLSLDNQKELVSCVLDNLDDLSTEQAQAFVATMLRRTRSEDTEQKRFAAACVFYSNFEQFKTEIDLETRTEKDLLWAIRNVGSGRRYDEKNVLPLSAEQLEWVIETFRTKWTRVPRPTRVTRGDTNPWDAPQFLHACIERLSGDLSDAATASFLRLISATDDEYTASLKSASASQQRSRVESQFEAPSLDQLQAALMDERPQTNKDLMIAFMAALDSLQARLSGDAAGTIDLFYTDEGKPKTENECRNVLISLMGDLPHDIVLLPEDQMPQNTRADLGVRCGSFLVPVEAKGQWNRGLWTAIPDQLDAFYTKDYRAVGCGLYLVFWFGRQSWPGRSIKRAPFENESPQSAKALEAELSALIPPGRRDQLKVVVLNMERRNGV